MYNLSIKKKKSWRKGPTLFKDFSPKPIITILPTLKLYDIHGRVGGVHRSILKVLGYYVIYVIYIHHSHLHVEPTFTHCLAFFVPSEKNKNPLTAFGLPHNFFPITFSSFQMFDPTWKMLIKNLEKKKFWFDQQNNSFGA